MVSVYTKIHEKRCISLYDVQLFRTQRSLTLCLLFSSVLKFDSEKFLLTEAWRLVVAGYVSPRNYRVSHTPLIIQILDLLPSDSCIHRSFQCALTFFSIALFSSAFDFYSFCFLFFIAALFYRSVKKHNKYFNLICC